jgi:hypothetical protein
MRIVHRAEPPDQIGGLAFYRRRERADLPTAVESCRCTLMVVWQDRQRKMSKSAASARDLLACMAMPQIGQERIGGCWE